MHDVMYLLSWEICSRIEVHFKGLADGSENIDSKEKKNELRLTPSQDPYL